jgi:hypothetical protein
MHYYLFHMYLLHLLHFSFRLPSLICVPFYCPRIYLDTLNEYAQLIVPIWVSESEKAENIQTKGQDWLQDMQVSNMKVLF